jgi:hypothetical protein
MGASSPSRTVAAAECERVDPEPLGQPLDLHLGGEERLRRAEAAEERRSAAMFVITTRERMRTFRAIVGAGGVQRAAREHDRRQRHVGAAVHHDLDVWATMRPSRMAPVR